MSELDDITLQGGEVVTLTVPFLFVALHDRLPEHAYPMAAGETYRIVASTAEPYVDSGRKEIAAVAAEQLLGVCDIRFPNGVVYDNSDGRFRYQGRFVSSPTDLPTDDDE